MTLFPLTPTSHTQPHQFANILPKFDKKYSRAETRMSIMYNTLSIGMQCSNLIYTATTVRCVRHHKKSNIFVVISTLFSTAFSQQPKLVAQSSHHSRRILQQLIWKLKFKQNAVGI